MKVVLESWHSLMFLLTKFLFLEALFLDNILVIYTKIVVYGSSTIIEHQVGSLSCRSQQNTSNKC